jgi:hypothetical protein
MRPAFSLVELLVAIVVFTIGVLTLAATAGLVAAHVGDGGRLTNSAHLARTVLDSLRTLPCASVRAGVASRGNLSAEWTVTRDSLSATVELTVASGLRRGTTRHTYSGIVACGGT